MSGHTTDRELMLALMDAQIRDAEGAAAKRYGENDWGGFALMKERVEYLKILRIEVARRLPVRGLLNRA